MDVELCVAEAVGHTRWITVGHDLSTEYVVVELIRGAPVGNGENAVVESQGF